MNKLNTIVAALYGFTIGDALGAPIEFDTLDEIHEKFGPEGITDFESYGPFLEGSITDDSQLMFMTLFYMLTASNSKSDVRYYYNLWRTSQDEPFFSRAPGLACLNMFYPGEEERGSGGLMRALSVGFFHKPRQSFKLAADFAKLSHGHPEGYLSAGLYAAIVSYLMQDLPIEDGIRLAMELAIEIATDEEEVDSLNSFFHNFMLARKDSVEELVQSLDNPWLSWNILIQALYVAVIYADNFEDGILAAVNHSGDSDTVGALAGALLAMQGGLDSIPEKWRHNVESRFVIEYTKNLLSTILHQKD